MSELVLDGIVKHFGKVSVINDIDLQVEDGEFVVFVGPSGCGKSTLLRIISGLESTTSGRVFIGGQDVTDRAPSKRQIAMVFQSYALFPHMSVAENIGFGLKLAKTHKSVIAERVAEVAEVLQLEPLLDRKPRELSGGQRQRVAIGRSIIRNPKVFLFDEPLSNLDAALRGQMRLEIARLHQRLGTTMIYVTHDQVEAMTLADRIVVINQGRIEQTGTPIELYENPTNLFVAGFIGAPSMNFLDVKLTQNEGHTVARFGSSSVTLETPLESKNPGKTTLGIRPEHLSIASQQADFKASVEIVEKLGVETLVYMKTEFSTEPVTLRTSPSNPLRPGDTVGVRMQQTGIRLFNSEGVALKRRA